jgi:hypothetical protein
MQEARRNREAVAKIGFDLGIPFNELNRLFDLGFAPLPWGDIGYVPKTMLPVGKSAQKYFTSNGDSKTLENVKIPNAVPDNPAAAPDSVNLKQAEREKLLSVLRQLRSSLRDFNTPM